MNLSRTLFRALGRRLPVTDGELTCDELSGTVSIRRDEYGIPHVDALNDWDAWFGLGFCHGQDRLFQLETIIRSVRGTLSEAVGVDGLPIDRLSRRVGIGRSARDHFDAMDDDLQQVFDAYARGINAGREHGLSRLPHEFSILRMPPTAWTGADSVGYFKLMSLMISTNWAEELARYKIVLEDGVGALQALEPLKLKWLPVTSPPGATAGTSATSLLEDVRKAVDFLGLEEGGSNNWVVSGKRTRSGRPILANDTHLSATLPTHFYLAHLTTPEWGIAGGTFLGGPGFFLGHNGFAAWGVTIGFLDSTDLFIEEIGPDGRSVREGDEFVPCVAREEHIRVKGADDVFERVLETRRGPIVGPVLDGRPGAVSMSATWLRSAPVRSVFSAHRWRSFDDFRRDLEDHPQLSLNFVYADESGDIGWMLAGHIPQRAGCGGFPLPATDPANHWRGEPRKTDERLSQLNPAEGYLGTTNNRPVTDCESLGFGIDWLEGYRQARVVELLAGRDDWDVPATWQMQLDMVSIPWRELHPILMEIEPVDADSSLAKAMLRNWDGLVSPASTSASLYEVFIAVMLRRIAEAAAPVTWKWALGQGSAAPTHTNYMGAKRFGYLIRLLKEQPDGWFEAGWPVTIAHSMGDALRALRAHAGEHVRSWNWGRVRPLRLTHSAGKGPLAPVFNRGPFPIGGDESTVHVAGVRPLDPFGHPRSIATARTVIEPGDWDNARFVLLGGQSGNPLSPHYDDQVPIWLQGRGVSIAWSPAAVEEATKETLRLIPASTQ